jgi:hypothetical protein
MDKPKVIVRGDVSQKVLLETEDAQAVEFYDCNGDLVAIFGKVFSNDFWSFSTKEDKDWDQVLSRMGLGLKEFQLDERNNA